jgi:hypothetical protein
MTLFGKLSPVPLNLDKFFALPEGTTFTEEEVRPGSFGETTEQTQDDVQKSEIKAINDAKEQLELVKEQPANQ